MLSNKKHASPRGVGSQTRTSNEILRAVEQSLTITVFGLEDFIRGPPERKIPGFWNLVAFGRAVTNILQNLRATEPAFDEWYSPFKQEMETDPLMRHFYLLRSEILKEGKTDVSKVVHIKQLLLPNDMAKFGTPPYGATGFFIGDEFNGTGWTVTISGETTKYYVELPPEIGSAYYAFTDPPKAHQGKQIAQMSVEDMSILYVNYLRRLVSSAVSRFSKSGSD
jgi:hypothetical protein